MAIMMTIAPMSQIRLFMVALPMLSNARVTPARADFDLTD